MKKTIQNIFKILSQHEGKKFIKLAALDVITSMLDIAFLAGLLWIINFYTRPNYTKFSYTIFPFINKYPLLPITVFFILFCIKNFIGFKVLQMEVRFVYDVASRLSQNKLLNYLNGSYTNYVRIDSSVQIRKINQQPIEFGHYVLGGLQQIISQSILISITIIAILIYNPVLFLLLLTILTPPVIIVGFSMKKKLGSIRKKAKSTSEKALQHLQEALSAYIESNLYERKNFFLKRYSTSQSNLNFFLSEQLTIQNIPSRLIEVFAIFGLFLLILLNSFTANTNSIGLITLAAFIAATYKIIPGIVKILNNNGQIKTYEFTINDLLQDEKVIIKTEQVNNKLHSVEFKNVSFRHTHELLLDNFYLEIKQGDFLGLSGKSGKGKTTIINLLLGFLEADKGSICINNKPATAIERQQYWKSISYVKQQQLMIYDSIANNITLTENFYDTQKLENAINATSLKDLINNYDDGHEIIITEDGKNISGGQRQRIAIARAIYKDAGLIILDEPFNELDRTSENFFLNYFKQLALAGKMVLLITHNKESLSFCDSIISLDEK